MYKKCHAAIRADPAPKEAPKREVKVKRSVSNPYLLIVSNAYDELYQPVLCSVPCWYLIRKTLFGLN